MSELYKLKYEVVAILQANIIKGLEAFGLQISSTPGDGGWVCMESDQPSFRSSENAILFWLEGSERIGWQSNYTEYKFDSGKFEDIEAYIEQQEWRIKIIKSRTVQPITEDSIPIMPDDIANMLQAWFNRLGCNEFRKHNMANLFVQSKDITMYKDKSDVSQWVCEFPLKLQVIKQFQTELEPATPQLGQLVPIQGVEKTQRQGQREGLFSRVVKKVKSILFTIRH